MKDLFHRFLHFFVGHGAGVLAAMLMMVLGTMAFIAITDYVSAGKADRIDRRINDHFRRHHNPQYIEDMIIEFTGLGGPGIWLPVAGLVWGYLIIVRKPAMAMLLLMAVFGGSALTVFLKGTIGRFPPGTSDQIIVSQYIPSFPSGHAMMATIVYLTIGTILAQLASTRAAKWYILLGSSLLVFLIGFSRVYLCIHWATDVLAGWAAGLVWALLCWVVTERLRQITAKRNSFQRETK